ncbi:MAG: SidE phosphodiesterase domain-containing protein [Coxiellaceae bacterium]|nr:SidE phosphodiesterase domain-containing protein [Coxiellaceae bacterium]
MRGHNPVVRKTVAELKAVSNKCLSYVDQTRSVVNLVSKDSAQRNPFVSIKIVPCADLIHQSPFKEVAEVESYQAVVMAASLVAHNSLFKLNREALVIPSSGACIAEDYYKEAMRLLAFRIQLLTNAYQIHLSTLKRALSAGKQTAISNSLNKVKQIQQYIAGASFIQKQYMLMQLNVDDQLELFPEAYMQCLIAAKAIARRNGNVMLTTATLQQQLYEAAAQGNVDRLYTLLAEPGVDVNQADLVTDRSALYLAVQANREAAVSVLVENGATESSDIDAEHSALTLAMMNDNWGMVKYLKQNLAIKSVIDLAPLHHGPSTKNLALKAVEYIFHCMLGIEHISDTLYEGELYAQKYDGDDEPYRFRLEKNSDNLWLAHCPNGRRYNLSLALKHANFEYFMLNECDKSQEIVMRCEKLLHQRRGGEAISRADKMTTDIGGIDTPVPLYAAEQTAIKYYTGTGSNDINPLLRGMSCDVSEIKLKEYFVHSMLVISGVNKHRSSDKYEERAVLTRHEKDDLPVDMLERMKTANQVVSRAAPLSFSEHGRVFSRRSNALLIKNLHQRQASIKKFSVCPGESEVIFPPHHLRFLSYDRNPVSEKSFFTTEIVSGLEVEYQQQYLLDLAMVDAYEILKRPYKESLDPRFGISRHYHALAHHVRACLLVEPVIKYFKQHAASDEFKVFCDHLTPEEITIMKLMMIFSRTGRESEAGPSQLAIFLSYNRKSAENLADFLRYHMDIDEDTINFYMDVLINAGNPRYAEFVTGATEEEKQRKLFFSYIAALAHKLDLPRVFGEAHYDSNVAVHNGSQEMTAGGFLVTASKQQKASFNRLEAIAMRMLQVTGDNLCFSRHGIDACSYDEAEFVKCNSDISYCWQQCQVATMQVLNENSTNCKKADGFMAAIKENNRQQVMHYLLHYTEHDFERFEFAFRGGVLIALMFAPHDYSDLLESCIPLLSINSTMALSALSEQLDSAHCNNVIVLPLVERLSLDDLIAAVKKLLINNAGMDLVGTVLSKIKTLDAGKYSSHFNVFFTQAVRSRYSTDALEVFIQAGAVVKAEHVLQAASVIGVDNRDVLLFLLSKINTIEILPAQVVFKLIIKSPAETQLPILHCLVDKGFVVTTDLLLKLITYYNRHEYNDTIMDLLLSKTDIEALSVASLARLLSASSDANLMKQMLDPHRLQHGAIIRALVLQPRRGEGSDINSAAAIKYMLSFNDGKFVDHCLDLQWRTELMLAVKSGKERVVDVFIEAGADVNLCDANGNFALTYALIGWNGRILDKLVHASNPLTYSRKNEIGFSPLTIAVLIPYIKRNAFVNNALSIMLQHCSVKLLFLLDIKRLICGRPSSFEVRGLVMRWLMYLFSTDLAPKLIMDNLVAVEEALDRKLIFRCADFDFQGSADNARIFEKIMTHADYGSLANALLDRCDINIGLSIALFERVANRMHNLSLLERLTKHYARRVVFSGPIDGLEDVLGRLTGVVCNRLVGRAQLEVVQMIATRKLNVEQPGTHGANRHKVETVLLLLSLNSVIRVEHIDKLYDCLLDKQLLISLFLLAQGAGEKTPKQIRTDTKRFFKLLIPKHCGLIFRLGDGGESRPDEMTPSGKRCVIS